MSANKLADDCLRRSVTALRRAYADREVAPVEVVEASLARLARVQPALHPLVADRAAAARRAAVLATRRWAEASDDAPPLLGVPVVVRESLAVAGSPHTAGSMRRRNEVAVADAAVVERLRAAGAILIGVTNGSEVGFWLEADTPLHGRTSNPWDPRRTAGGDGGGDACAVAAGIAPLAVGVDRFGGNRVPAAFCGVVGHKPSPGVSPLTGLFPLPFGRSRHHASVGVLARHAMDIEPVMRAIHGPDGVDRSVLPVRLHDPARIDFTWRRVMVCADPDAPGIRMDREVTNAVVRAGEILARRGADVESWRPAQFGSLVDIWMAMVHEAHGLTYSFRDVLADGDSVSLTMEVLRRTIRRQRHSLPALGMVALERLSKGYFARIQHFCAEGRRLRDRMNLLLADGGVLLMPVYPTVAPRHGGTLLQPGAIALTAVFNVLGLPATSVPIGLSKKGLPLAVQVVSAQGNDDACLAAAVALQQGAGVLESRRRL